MKSASVFSNGRSKERGNLAFIYQHFWNTNIQFNDGIKRVCHQQFEFFISASVIPAEAAVPEEPCNTDVTPKSKAAVSLSSDHFLQALTEIFPPQFVVQKSNKASMSACARANPLPLRSPVAKYAFERRVCKVQICRLASQQISPSC